MQKGKYIEELTPGSSFSHSLFVARNPEVKQGKAGNPYAMFNIEDRTGCAPAKLWNITPDLQQVLLSNTFFYMSGQVDNGQYSGQVSVSSIKPVAESDIDPNDFLAPLPDDHQVHYDRFIHLVKSIKNPHLKQLLRTVFGTPTDMLRRFRDAVAAKTMHHSHRGGLIEHTTEVAEMCDKMCEVFPTVNRDLVVTCALLHDIGKLEELEHGIKHGEYTADGALIGHIVLGTQTILSAIGPDFPPLLKKLLMHLILSHHGKGEFGSPKTPATPEAFILAACDDLSAKLNQTKQAISTARVGQINARASDFYVYVGDYDYAPPETPAVKARVKEPLLHFEVDCARLPISGTDDAKDIALPSAGADYLLRVTESSMDASGVLPGDLVFVNEALAPVDQSLVAVVIDGKDETVRRLVIDGESKMLVSDDPKFPTTPLSATVRVVGRITGLIREI